MTEPQTYVALKPCGCLAAAVVNVPKMLAEVGKMMTTAARHGERVELLDTEQVRTMPWKCVYCLEEKERAMFGKVTLVILALAISAVVGISGGYAYRYFIAPVEGKVGAQEQIQSAPQRIQAYNYFFDLYGAIQSYSATLAALQEQLAQTTSEAEQERIRATIAGLKGQRARAIQEYNVSARKSYTIGQFKDSGLPYQITEEK